KRAKETAGRAPSFLVAVCRATVQALADFPRLNAVVQDETVILRKDINLGVAVETEKGLLVPVIRKANELSVLGLARALDDLAARSRTGKVTADEQIGRASCRERVESSVGGAAGKKKKRRKNRGTSVVAVEASKA